uniref:Thiol:disulfide interchange protein n=1 Tax=Psychrobacter sp. (strain PRwf-1) TaxID=349106 RepID=A5WBF6_PSYWF
MSHFLNTLRLICSKSLTLSLAMPVLISALVIMPSAHADLSAFNEAYDKLAANDSRPLKAPTPQQQDFIKQILSNAGMMTPIASIQPSKLPSMYQITLVQNPSTEPQPPLHITADGAYILQGELKPNPSPVKVPTPQQLPSKTLSGMPVSDDLRASMLKNSSLLKNMTPDVALYHTAVPGVIWGATLKGQPFITNTEATVFTSGEISVIENGQFAGLDADFEQKKNLHVLSSLDDDNLVIYPATTTEKAVIYVATDINCPYCRVLHQDMAKLNAKGVTVKVIAYPYYEQSPEQMRQIWCAADKAARKQALDEAMSGKPVNNTCRSGIDHLKANQVKAAGLAVFATPAIYREDGAAFNAPYKDPSFLPFLGLN